MTAESLKTLFHPFEAELLPLPRQGARVLFLGAEPGFRLPGGFDALLHPVQGFRPHFRALQASGYMVTPRAEGSAFDAARIMPAPMPGSAARPLWKGGFMTIAS